MRNLGLGDLAFLGAVGGVERDPFFANVSLLLHGDGTNGSTTITDSSLSPKTVTAVGDAKISTAQSKFGGASIAFDGAADYLQLDPALSDLSLGTSACTIEAWIQMTAFSTANTETYWPIVIRGAAYNVSAGHTQSYDFRYSPQHGNRLVLIHRNSSAGFTEGTHMFTKVSTVLNLSFNTWYHVAAVRDGDNIRLYLGGSDVTDTSTGNYTWSSFDFSLNSTDNVFEIGRARGANGPFGSTFWDANGFIDELRITKGVARYTSNFTPPSAPFPDA